MEDLKRQTKDNYYLDIAEAVGEKSTCLRRHYGAVIVKNDEIIATGYNGSPRGCLNCNEDACMRETLGVVKGRGYNICGAVHAEMNAVISAARRDMIDATIYIVGRDAFGKMAYADPTPCLLCHRMLCNSGITRFVGRFATKTGTEPRDIEVSANTFMLRMQREYEDCLEEMDSSISSEQRMEAQANIDRRYTILRDRFGVDISDFVGRRGAFQTPFSKIDGEMSSEEIMSKLQQRYNKKKF